MLKVANAMQVTHPLTLSNLVGLIGESIEDRFADEVFWIKAEITDVRKQPAKKWCFLKFIEKEDGFITTEIRGVTWSGAYNHIEEFEKTTGQRFADGLEIITLVTVRFHQRYGLSLEILAIDYTFALGKMEIEKQQTLDRLVKENPTVIQLIDEQYQTINNRTALPLVIQRIALVTAPKSDGQRDFLQELTNNTYGYAFSVKEFLTQIQGDKAPQFIMQQLRSIEDEKSKYDVVVIVRGGGSQTDLKPFDDYDLARCIALFPVPVLTGIGHDRNVSITDLMARQYKTPTKVASFVVERNFTFENAVLNLKDRFTHAVEKILENAKTDLQNLKRIVSGLSPSAILNKGFAILTLNGNIITEPGFIKPKDELKTILKTEMIHSIVTHKSKNENKSFL